MNLKIASNFDVWGYFFIFVRPIIAHFKPTILLKKFQCFSFFNNKK